MRKVKIHKIYEHFKGDSYIVEGFCIDCETLKRCVLYRQLYGDGELYVRTEEDFLSEIDHKKYPNIKRKYRFTEKRIKSRRIEK